mmetsp:Transcript_27495/g.63581  ORF Transcript_27495/g.63581 Transcript_27495/m.63581 type:complete len:209 (+) Transcript_27495:392-1018(+)
MTTEQLICHTTDAPNITLWSITGTSLCHLWRHAYRRAAEVTFDFSGVLQAHRATRIILSEAKIESKAKVRYLYVRIFILTHHQHILKLQVAMHYTHGVHVVNCMQHLLDNASHHSLREVVQLHNAVIQTAPISTFHDYPHGLVTLDHLYEVHNVPVPQLAQASNLVADACFIIHTTLSGDCNLFHRTYFTVGPLDTVDRSTHTFAQFL